MKYLFILIFTSLSVHFKCQPKSLDKVETEVFHHISKDGFKDIIQINRIKDSIISGKYSGTYVDPDGKVFFYYSQFFPENIHSTYDLVFVLSNFMIADSPISLDTKYNINEQKASVVPYVFQAPIRFLGDFVNDKLLVNRIMQPRIMSGSESMVFERTKK